MDHPSSILMAEDSGVDVEVIPALATGLLDLNWLTAALANHDIGKDGRPFVSVAIANSETGVIQDAVRIVDMIVDAEGLLLLDAVQAFGKIPLSVMALADYVAVSAHKIGGPQGVGALYVNADAPFSSLMVGGGQEKRRRAGTHNTAGIAGFGAAAKVGADASVLKHTRDVRDAIQNGLTSMEPNITIFGQGVPRIPNTLLFGLRGTASSTLMMGLDLENICVSTGLACSSGTVGASRAVTAMGLSDTAPNGAIRISLGYTSKQEDAGQFLKAWAKIRRIAYPKSLEGAA